MSTIEIKPSEIVTALSFGSNVFGVRENYFKRESKTAIELPASEPADSAAYAVFYTARRGWKRIECHPSESYLAYRSVLAA